MKTMPSVEAQNRFGALIDAAQREPVAITRRGRTVAFMIAPEALTDFAEGWLAQKAEAEGFLEESEASALLTRLRSDA